MKTDDTYVPKYIHIDQEIASKCTVELGCICVQPCMHEKHEAWVSHVGGYSLEEVLFENYGKSRSFKKNRRRRRYLFLFLPHREFAGWRTCKLLRDMFSLSNLGWGPSPSNQINMAHQIIVYIIKFSRDVKGRVLQFIYVHVFFLLSKSRSSWLLYKARCGHVIDRL